LELVFSGILRGDPLAGLYNPCMARGWESKSVAEQQAEAAEARVHAKPRSAPDKIAFRQGEQRLQLSRKYLVQQLEVAQNPRYRRMLECALADLDARLSRLS
jgi:hypothetical protein